MIHDIHRKTPSPDKIYLLMMAVKEKGWKAVEGSIPPELRDEVLKACAQAGVSLTAAETKKETVVQKSVSAERSVFYGDAEHKSQNGMPAYKPLPVFDFRNIDAKRPYAVNDNKVQSREAWRETAKERSANACEVLGLKGGDAQAYLDAVDVMQAHKDKWTWIRRSGQLTPEMEEAFKKKNDELAREEAYALAIASGLKTPEEIEALRKQNLPSKSKQMQELFDLRDVAQLGTKEQMRAFLNGDRSMMKEINDKNRALKAQTQLKERADAMGVPMPRTPEEKNRLNRDFEYWQHLRRAHDNDMNAVEQEFQKYLEMSSEKEKEAERSRLAEEIKVKNGARKAQKKQAQKQAELASKTEITYASNEPREAVMVKMNFMEAALENPQDEAFADMNKALKELGVRSVEDFYDEKKMTKALQIGQKAYGREVWNAVREAKGQSPLSEEAWQKRAKPAKDNQAREQVAGEKSSTREAARQNSAQKAQAKQAQKQAEPASKTEITYTSDEPQEAVIVKMSFMKAALENPQDEAFADMNKALKELGVRSVEDFYDEKKMTKALQIGQKAYGQEAWNAVCEAVRQSSAQKAQSALEEKAAAMGMPVPQTPEERKELNRDFEYWQNLRRANGNDMNAVKQGFAKYRSMDDTAQKAERMRLAEEVAVKNKASAEKPKAKESTLSLMQKVGRPHEMSLAEKMRARGQAEDREEIAERLERMKSRTREQTPAQRKSDRGAQMDRYVHDMQSRA